MFELERIWDSNGRLGATWRKRLKGGRGSRKKYVYVLLPREAVWSSKGLSGADVQTRNIIKDAEGWSRMISLGKKLRKFLPSIRRSNRYYAIDLPFSDNKHVWTFYVPEMGQCPTDDWGGRGWWDHANKGSEVVVFPPPDPAQENHQTGN